MEKTDRLELPLIVPGQSQKELFHNEALQALDTLVAACAETPPSNSPPAAPQPGECFIVGAAPTGDWGGYPDHVAAFTSGGWRFIAPRHGLSVREKTSDTVATYGALGWEVGTVRATKLLVGGNQVVGARAGAIPDPQGGTFVDTEARASLGAILSALRQHGLISP